MRPRSNTSLGLKFVTVTVLYLVAAGLITLNFDTRTNECTCKLVVINAMPAYLNDTIWDLMYIIDEDGL